MNTDIEGLNIYILDSFDRLATLLTKDVIYVSTRIPDFSKRQLQKRLREETGLDEFAEIFIPLVDEKFDMYNLQDVSNGLGMTIPPRNKKEHPVWGDIEVNRGEVKPVQIGPGSFALICKSVTGCCWEVEWWFVKIVPKQMPTVDEDTYEKEFMEPWDGIRKMLLVDRDEGDLPRMSYEQTIDTAYEMGYNRAIGRKNDN